MLSKLKVIDASTVLAGPSVGTFFAELGAEVIKVENPAIPDVTRSWKLPGENQEATVSAYFSSVNYQKKYQGVNLKSEEGRADFLTLLRDADVLITNFKKGDAEKFGLTDEVLFEINPRLIIGKISGYGLDSDRVAYDLILQAETGFMSMNGTPDSGPVKMPVALIDVLAAHHLKEGILLALLKREQNGKGSSVHVSLYDAAVCSLVNQASNYLMSGHVPKRIGSLHPNIAPYGELFRSKDGRTITFAIGSNAHFQRLCHFLDLDELIEDNRFKENQDRVKNRDELYGILDARVANKTVSEWMEWSAKSYVPLGVVRDLSEVLNEEKAKSLIREEELHGLQTKRVSSLAFKIS
ncbi:MAG: CoA transferase [Bacteroidetes bacterium]|nr:MAG: CoA transferase [Bacteroidota bacterium]